MELFEAITARCSYRGQYRADPVPRARLERIMQAGLDAPSGCNLQTTSLIGVDDPALLKPLGAALGRVSFASAPAAICVLTRRLVAYGDVFFNVQDYSAAIENMLLAAAALGYASCWVEGNVTSAPSVQAGMSEILRLPEGYELVAFLPVGVPAERAPRARKEAFARRAWFNQPPLA